MYDIEKNQAPDRLERGISNTIPFDKLVNKGDSVLIPYTDMSNGVVKTAAHRYKKAHDIKLSVYREETGSRVFRR